MALNGISRTVYCHRSHPPDQAFDLLDLAQTGLAWVAVVADRLLTYLQSGPRCYNAALGKSCRCLPQTLTARLIRLLAGPLPNTLATCLQRPCPILSNQAKQSGPFRQIPTSWPH